MKRRAKCSSCGLNILLKSKFCCIVFNVGILLSLACLLLVTCAHFLITVNNYQYAIVVDIITSNQSIAYLYRWNAVLLNGTGLVEFQKQSKLDCGLFLPNEGLSESLWDLSECIYQSVNQLNPTFYDPYHKADIFITPTSVLQLLNLTKPLFTQKVMTELSAQIGVHFESKPLKRVELISADQQAMYLWAANNYIATTNHTQTGNGMAIVEIGPTSSKVAYEVVTNLDNHPNESMVILYDTNHYLNTASILCYGYKEAIERYYRLTMSNHIIYNSQSLEVESPCTARGHTKPITNFNPEFSNICKKLKLGPQWPAGQQYRLMGIGNIDNCNAKVSEWLFDKWRCSQLLSYCNESKYDPAPLVNLKLYALGQLARLTPILRVISPESMEMLPHITMELFSRTVNKLCAATFDELKQLLKEIAKEEGEEYLSELCFQMVYAYQTLNELLGMEKETHWKELLFFDNVDPTKGPIHWTMGYLLNWTSSEKSGPSKRPMISRMLFAIGFAVTLTCLVLCSLLAIYNQIKMKRRDRKSTVTRSGIKSVAQFGFSNQFSSCGPSSSSSTFNSSTVNKSGGTLFSKDQSMSNSNITTAESSIMAPSVFVKNNESRPRTTTTKTKTTPLLTIQRVKDEQKARILPMFQRINKDYDEDRPSHTPLPLPPPPAPPTPPPPISKNPPKAPPPPPPPPQLNIRRISSEEKKAILQKHQELMQMLKLKLASKTQSVHKS